MSDEYPRVTFKQPFFHDKLISESVERMRRSITSITALEAAYRIAQPEMRSRGISATRSQAEEALNLYNKAVQDGRFIKELTKDPAGVAEKLGLELSPEVASLMQETGTLSILQAQEAGAARSDVELVAVAIIVIFLVSDPNVDVVIDESGLIKL